MEKFLVSRDDSIYEAWPDLVLTKNGKLLCFFTETEHHKIRRDSRLVYCESVDRGRTWSAKKPFTDVCPDRPFWNAVRVKRLKDDSLVVLCDLIAGEKETDSTVYIWRGDSEGENWEGPYETPVRGIVPDKILELDDGRWIVGAHERSKDTGKLTQYAWYSDDKGKTWSDRVVVGANPDLNLCEVSMLQLGNGVIVAFMRENSGKGYDCYKSFSYDGGKSFQDLCTIPLPACHRPVSGFLQSGHIMIGYRFIQSGRRGFGYDTQNFFVALTDEESAGQTDRTKQWTRIKPIDFDRSRESDLGYCGWVQFDDGEIYIVNYIRDDSPKCQIVGYSLYENEFWV